MSELHDGSVRRLDRLQRSLGRDVELIDGDGNAETYRLLAEYAMNGSVYAALQTSAMRKEDEIAFFIVEERENGELSLSTIDDEDEWEAAAEGYDELLFDENNE